MEHSPSPTSDILWYDLREKYHDDRIYPSQSKSIIENFQFRLFSQDKNSFPIKLIRSIFTNAVNISTQPGSNTYSSEYIENAKQLKIKLENAIDFCVDRILIHVYDSNTIDGPNSITRSQGNIWAYPVAAIKKLGFQPINGGVFIELYRPNDNIRQVYSPNPTQTCWSKVTNVQNLSQLTLKCKPSKDSILLHNMPDSGALKKIVDMDIPISDLDAKYHTKHPALWNTLFPLLENLFRDTVAILSHYNINLVSR